MSVFKNSFLKVITSERLQTGIAVEPDTFTNQKTLEDKADAFHQSHPVCVTQHLV